MCNVLIIEDQDDIIVKFKKLAEKTELTFLSPEEVGLTKLQKGIQESVEEQLARHLKDKIAEFDIDLVLLDTDLSREQDLQTHSSYKAALRELGMPVCRYQKGGSDSVFALLPQLQRTIRDGASAIWVPRALVSGNREHELVARLIALSNGFKSIRKALEEHAELLEKAHSPTEVLAVVLGDVDRSYEFLGYAAQNLVYFAKPEADVEAHQISKIQRYSTQLGYWLFNYIITFPGPILKQDAALAHLNIHPDASSQGALSSVIESSRYQGPFDDVEQYFWRSKLVDILERFDGDITSHPDLKDVELKRIDSEDPGSPAYICMLSGYPITRHEAATNPDWVPSGASEAKIKDDVLDELGPLAGI